MVRWAGSGFAEPLDWGQVMSTGDIVRVADMNGDSYADVVNFQAGGAVKVAFACGSALGWDPIPGCNLGLNKFGTLQPWVTGFRPSASDAFLSTGDFNGDGYADSISVTSGSNGRLKVALTHRKPCSANSDCSDTACMFNVFGGTCRAAFGQAPLSTGDWGTGFGLPIEVADVDGDDFDDVIFAAFSTGLVDVARANPFADGGQRFNTRQRWSNDYCKGVLCLMGDANGDGRSDFVRFIRDSVTGQRSGDVDVALVQSP